MTRAQSFTAQIDAWVKKTQKRERVILRQAANNLIRQASRTATGVTRGGDRMRGFVPRDTGFLANSLISSLHGGTMLSGAASYRMVIAGMEPGDVAEFGWSAEYARRLHYGFSGTDSRGRTFSQPGWFWVDEAANDWPRIVREAIALAKARVK